MTRVALLPLALLAAVAHAGTLLGLTDAGIYRIDTVTGASTLAASLAGFGSGTANALAYDAATGTAYFQRNGDLWRGSLANGAFAKLGATVGATDAATFANGAYLFGTSAGIRSVDVATGAISTFGAYDKGWGFGDVATLGNALYGSSGTSVFRIDLTTKAYTALSDAGKQLQLAFDGATLYGVANGNAGAAAGTMFTIDTATGVLSNTGVVARYDGGALALNDAATLRSVGVSPVPEPSTLAALALGALALRRRRARNRSMVN